MEYKSQRVAYMEALIEEAKNNKDIVVLEADLANSTKTVLFKEHYPDRFFEVGIAEQNMTSVAAGLALSGKKPFTHTFAIFATSRAYDQIRQGICIPKLNVKICGSSAGFSDYSDGSTHQSIDDLAIMKVIPNMTVLVPVDAVEVKKMVKALVDYEGPTYFRINRNDVPVVTSKDDVFEIGKMSKIQDGDDIVVFTNGIMVSKAIEAAEILKEKNISLKIMNVSTLKPFDVTGFKDAIKDAKGVIVAEEHLLSGGLGSTIAELMAGEINLPLKRIGVNDVFGKSALGYKELLDAYNLNAQSVVDAAKEIMEN